MNLRRICDADNSQERVQPKTREELIKLIKKTIEEKGNDCDLNFIDTSFITDMSRLFNMFWKFNGDISKWDVTNVTDMNNMFCVSGFNGDISNWDVSSVTDMSEMFYHSKFNGDISNWDVSNVTNMYSMFSVSEFNGDISKWDTSNVTDMSHMFASSEFNGDISNWDTSNVTTMHRMFAYAEFDGDTSNWDVKNQCDVEGMFDESRVRELPKWFTRLNSKKKTKRISKPAWLKKFVKASEGMPYMVHDESYDPEEGFVTVTVSDFVPEADSYPTEWMRKAAEADAKAKERYTNRWNPSWDVAAEALAEVCDKLNLNIEDSGGESDYDMYSVSPND